jgi:alkanesulfonate monooxygenase SsuD/methylene tetrahydromethanopterin reductase-like flavin-dependent oxidoreductase (luciferase family)
MISDIGSIRTDISHKATEASPHTMNIISAIRFNMTSLSDAHQNHASRYRAALEMSAYADRHRFSIVNLEEHHCASNGWLPSPLTMAGAVIGATQQIKVNVTALLVTLYDPIRLAEDIAVLDLMSDGRFNFVAGLGYRPEEYHAMDKAWSDRGQLMDTVIDTLLKAWGDDAFEYQGQMVNVTPKPQSKPHPFFFIGGMSKAAARRAARFGLPFYPPMAMPELEALYYAELKKHGNEGFVYYPSQGNSMHFIHPEPEQAWEEFGPYFLNESREYASWRRDGVPRPSEDHTETINDLREQKRFEILTPEQCLNRIEDGLNTVVIHPLVGGLPLEHGWSCLRLLQEQVLSRIGA